LMANAEAAVRQAKARTRGSFRFFSMAENRKSARRLSLASDLRHALERDELRLHYQPQLESASGAVVGIEALIRWQHPVRGLIGPSEFIEVAEESGLIVPIGEWVIRNACEQAQGLRASGVDPFVVGVNLSPRQIRDKGLVPAIRDALQRTGLPASHLDIEITETGLVGESRLEIDVLCEIKRLGASISVDDFGTGYSSLSYLTRLPIDGVKIDKSFIGECVTKSASASIVRAIMAMAGSLDLTTVAEGVESEAQRAWLMKEGCRLIQGFLVAEPMPMGALQEWMARRARPNDAQAARAWLAPIPHREAS